VSSTSGEIALGFHFFECGEKRGIVSFSVGERSRHKRIASEHGMTCNGVVQFPARLYGGEVGGLGAGIRHDIFKFKASAGTMAACSDGEYYDVCLYQAGHDAHGLDIRPAAADACHGCRTRSNVRSSVAARWHIRGIFIFALAERQPMVEYLRQRRVDEDR
jgi:hypothetical protein